MKKLFTFLFMLVAVTCYGEIISEVRFNPSRMGEYDYLKVSQKATLAGGLQANQFNVKSADTVRIVLDSVLNYFNVNTQVEGDSGTTLDFGPYANGENYDGAFFGGGTRGQRINLVDSKGGKGDFSGGEESSVSAVKGGNRLKQKAGTFSGGTVTITGHSSSAGKGLYSGGSSLGFRLAGVDIPTPVGARLKGASSISNCSLKWEDRKIAGANDTVKVLALANCNRTISTPSTPSTPSGKRGCYQIVKKAPVTYRYTRSNQSNYSNCLSALGVTCPSHFVPGVFIADSDAGSSCAYTAESYCQYPSEYPSGATFTGSVVLLGPDTNNKQQCDPDDIVSLH